MSESAPEAAASRYFLHPDGGFQAVHNLADPGPYLAAGCAEVDEATYRAALDAGDGA